MFAQRFVRWDVEHPVYAQLMGWRPVPGYQPSAEAYASAVDAYEAGRSIFGTLFCRGLSGRGAAAFHTEVPF